jgi:hypothetical protein
MLPLPVEQPQGAMPLAAASAIFSHTTAPPFAVVTVLDSALLNTVYDVCGRLIEERRVGGSWVHWSARGLPAGIYFVQIEAVSRRPIARGRAIASP